jgi:hypothetical protein
MLLLTQLELSWAASGPLIVLIDSDQCGLGIFGKKTQTAKCVSESRI